MFYINQKNESSNIKLLHNSLKWINPFEIYVFINGMIYQEIVYNGLANIHFYLNYNRNLV